MTNKTEELKGAAKVLSLITSSEPDVEPVDKKSIPTRVKRHVKDFKRIQKTLTFSQDTVLLLSMLQMDELRRTGKKTPEGNLIDMAIAELAKKHGLSGV